MIALSLQLKSYNNVKTTKNNIECLQECVCLLFILAQYSCCVYVTELRTKPRRLVLVLFHRE